MTYKPEEWNLSYLFKDQSKEALEKVYTDVVADVDAFAIYEKKLPLSIEDFGKALSLSEKISAKSRRLLVYLDLRFYGDTKDQVASALSSKYSTAFTKESNKMLFFNLWFKNLTHEEAKKYMDAYPRYAYYLERVRAYKNFTLSEKEERLMNLLDPYSSEALITIYDVFCNDFTYNLDGKEVTYEEVRSLFMSPDKEQRHKAYTLVMEKYSKHRFVINEIYKNIVMDWQTCGVDIRGHKTTLDVRSFSEDIEEESVRTLFSVCRKNAPLLQRYFKLKAKMLGENKLHRHDLYAPVVKIKAEYDYGEAVNTVLNLYNNFDKEMGVMAKTMFQDHLVDALPRQGKRSGAFCYSFAQHEPAAIMLNFTNTYNDVATIAHEIGHGIHHLLSSKNNILFNVHAVIPLCETASVMGEQLLMDHTLKTADTNMKIYLLENALSDLYQTVFRQIYFVLFEDAAHKAYKEGATIDELGDIYMNLLHEHFGDAVEIPEHFKWEWCLIPHIFHTPFYCYSYGFGFLLSLSLYKKYKDEGESFVPQIKKILEAGASAKPSEIVAAAGFDINSAEFWQNGYDLVKNMLDELEKLIEE